MADRYLDLVNRPAAGKLARRLGLPRPAALRRHTPDAPLTVGPVLILGAGSSADGMAELIAGWGVEVLRRAAGDADGGGDRRLGGVVLMLDELTDPSELGPAALALGRALGRLLPSGRVVTVARRAADTCEPATAAARQAIDGFTRSVARELRSGSTANGVVLGADVPLDAPGAAGAVRFLLSARSAFVSGQFLAVTSSDGSLPRDWNRPLDGRLAVVTGAARGIGAAIAEVLHRDGARVIAVDLPAAGEQLAKVANSVRGVAVQLDIAQADASERLADALRRHGRPVDILVHNAGITRDRLLVNLDEARWNAVMEVNLQAQLRLNDALLAGGLFAPESRIVCLASTSGIAGNRGQTNYAASKAGVIGMVRATARRGFDAGNVTGNTTGSVINAVAPGFIETEMTARMPLPVREAARRLSSLQQGGLPVDVAETVAFLSSAPAGGINGEVVRVCGQNLVGA